MELFVDGGANNYNNKKQKGSKKKIPLLPKVYLTRVFLFFCIMLRD